jgi:hypothetical protein
MTFIGTWRDDSPEDIIALKRQLDSNFHCAAPLFSPAVNDAYDALMELTFSTFGLWGHDAQIKSSAYRRRQSWIGAAPWKASWDTAFVIADDMPITKEWLTEYRTAYDRLLSAFVDDVEISRSRQRYTSDEVSLNAHSPSPRAIEGTRG